MFVGKKQNKMFYSSKHSKLHNLGLYMLFFAIVGGAIMLFRSGATTGYVGAPHHAACVSVTPSKYFVRPGEKFTAVVKMKNDGSSTWGPSWGFFLDEVNSSGVETNNWNVVGNAMTYNVGPGGTATFNLTLTAPPNQGFYHFNWSMAIAWTGILKEPCNGGQIIVVNPPAVSLYVNNQPSNISLTQGSGLTVSWTATNGPVGCTASDSWSGQKSPPSGGSENRTGDTASPGTKTYSLVCSNYVGSSAKVSRSVTVNAAPSSSTPPATSKPGTTGNRSSSGGTIPIITTDTTPPTAPANFSSNYKESSVELSWDASSDNQGISGYELERSTDQNTWDRIGGTITDQLYVDSDVKFDTTYYYRLRALDLSNNFSTYATTEIKTGAFEPNANAEEALTLNSDDGAVTVSIPIGAVDEAASCSLVASRYLQPSPKNYESVTGPYELLCKTATGDRITKFSQPVTVKLQLSDSAKKRYSAYKFYTRSSDWEEVEPDDSGMSFTLGDSVDFAILGQTKQTPLWQKILKVLFIIFALVGGGLVVATRVYRWRVKRQIEQQNRDHYNKEHGY